MRIGANVFSANWSIIGCQLHFAPNIIGKPARPYGLCFSHLTTFSQETCLTN